MGTIGSSEGYIELSRLCKVNGLNVEQDQIQLLRQYVDVLLEWNSKVNLVSRQDQSNVWTRHILHSLSILFHIDIQRSLRVLDLGTGGGLPGIPLAIVRPDLQVDLLDSILKKVKALEDIIRRLKLKNVTAVCGRAGEIGLDRLNSAGYDVVVARAVAPLSELVKWSSKLVCRNVRNGDESPGQTGAHSKMRFQLPLLLAMKGGDIDREISVTRMKYKEKQLHLLNLSISGLQDQEFIDKKVIIVGL